MKTIKSEIMSWPGVTSQPHAFGGIDFRIGPKEIGHLHGENIVDLPLPPNIFLTNSYNKNKLMAPPKQGREEVEGSLPHDTYPECKWINYWIKGEDDVPQVIALFRLQYDRLTKVTN